MLKKRLLMVLVLITLFGIASLMLFNFERVSSKVYYVSLRYDFKKGDEFIYKVVTETKSNFRESFSKETMFITVKVLDVDECVDICLCNLSDLYALCTFLRQL